MAITISAALVSCLTSFNQIAIKAEQAYYQHEAEVSSVSWKDELGRLRVWAANIGAHQSGQSSLEFRLREASHIKQHVLKLLKDLESLLFDIRAELSEDRPSMLIDDEALDLEFDEDATSEVQQLFGEVVNVIDCLYQLSMLIRKPAQHDVLMGSRMDDAALAFAPFDKEHVRNKCVGADDEIAERLGQANTGRRSYFRYRDRHHAKLASGIEEAQGIQRAATNDVLSETMATEFDLGGFQLEETSSTSGASQTTYATSLASGGPITVPELPGNWSAGKPLECPYCWFFVEVNGQKSWMRHVFQDLKPYVCTFAKCNIPERLYESRREWFSHIQKSHQEEIKNLDCPLCNSRLASLKLLERHMARHLEEIALFALPSTKSDEEKDRPNDDIASGAIHTDTDYSDSRSSADNDTDVHSLLLDPAQAVDHGTNDDLEDRSIGLPHTKDAESELRTEINSQAEVGEVVSPGQPFNKAGDFDFSDIVFSLV